METRITREQSRVRFTEAEVLTLLRTMSPLIPNGAMVVPLIDPITEDFKGIEVVWDDFILAAARERVIVEKVKR